MPPVVVTVDFGDGSGEQKWDRDHPHDVWTHKYSKPGMYTIFVMCKLKSIFATAMFVLNITCLKLITSWFLVAEIE